MAFQYEPSFAEDWLAVASAGRVLVAKADGDADRLRMLAGTWGDDVSVQQVLETLTANGLGATGPFALVFWVDGEMAERGLGVIVRGDATVDVETPDGTMTISSAGVTTWTEQVVERAKGFLVSVPGQPATSGTLPLREGVAWVRAIGAGVAEFAAAKRTADNDVERRGAEADRDETAAEREGIGRGQVAPDAEPAGPTPARSTARNGSTSTGSDARQTEQPVQPAADVEATRVFHTTTGIPDTVASESPADDRTAGQEAEHDYDYLFDATIVAPSSARARARQQTQAGEPASAPGQELGDHDGHTVLASDVRAARRSARDAANAPSTTPQSGQYALVLPDGNRQALTAPVVLGRAPSVSHVPASVLPHLVTLVGDDISRSHVRVAVEGGTVVVTDLHSSNGTQVIAPGRPPQLLRGGEPTPVITGTAIDLGSGVVLQVTDA